MSKEFEAKFCGCCDAVGPCLFACCFPVLGVSCLQCGSRNAYHGEGGCIAYLCSCCLGCYGNAFNRMKLRGNYEIKGTYIGDCLIYMCFLGLCGVVQEYREVRLRLAPK